MGQVPIERKAIQCDAIQHSAIQLIQCSLHSPALCSIDSHFIGTQPIYGTVLLSSETGQYLCQMWLYLVSATLSAIFLTRCCTPNILLIYAVAMFQLAAFVGDQYFKDLIPQSIWSCMFTLFLKSY